MTVTTCWYVMQSLIDDHDIDEEPDTVVDEQPDQFDVEVQPLCQVSLCVS